jgi:hypothetical protein
MIAGRISHRDENKPMMKSNQMDTESCKPEADAAWEVWYQDLFDREFPRKMEVSGQGLVPGLAELWARHLFETVQADGQTGFSHFNLWWRQKQKSIEITGAWDGMVQLRNWVFGNKHTANQGYLGEGNQALLREVALVHLGLIMVGKGSEPILKAAQNCTRREVFQEELKNLIQATSKEK